MLQIATAASLEAFRGAVTGLLARAQPLHVFDS
jgi:hypothetical protein